MTDLSDFSVGTHSWGEMYLQCNECYWSGHEDDWGDGTLADLVRLAEAHRCAQVVPGELAAKQINGGPAG